MSDCVFCRIIQGQIPGVKVFEDESVVAILDINPITRGHTLVLPKAHHETLVDLPAEALQATVRAVQRVAPAVLRGVGADGFNVLQNNHRCAGQAIPHVHFHVIPRKIGDGVRYQWNPGKYAEGEMESIAAEIRKALA